MIKTIAITGKIASGKSTVAQYVAKKGYSVIDCDRINAELLKNEFYLKGLQRLFPDAFPNGVFDKKTFSDIIFQDACANNKIRDYAHPIIFRLAFWAAMRSEGTVFIEVPLLFGSGYEGSFDRIWLIESDDQEKVERIVRRDGRSKEQSKSILLSQTENQYDLDNIVKIRNDGSIGELQKAVDRLFPLNE